MRFSGQLGSDTQHHADVTHQAVAYLSEAARLLHSSRQWHSAAQSLEIAQELCGDNHARVAMLQNARVCWFQANQVEKALQCALLQAQLETSSNWQLVRDTANYLRYLGRIPQAHALAETIDHDDTRCLAVSWFLHRQGLMQQAFDITEQARSGTYWWRRKIPYLHRIWDKKPTGTLVVVGESGAGDQIIFSRWIPLLRTYCQDLYYDSEDKDLCEIISDSLQLTKFDSTKVKDVVDIVPIMSLPSWLSVTTPGHAAYITALPRKSCALPDTAHHMRIGICTSGDRSHIENNLRSLPLASLADALAAQGCLINLEKNPVHHHDEVVEPCIRDWHDVMSCVDQCDIIVSCDTGVAHLAAAMGKPVIVLIHSAAYFTWNHHEDLGLSDWYRQARCIHQDTAGDWTRAISKCSDLVQQISMKGS